ncbi:hypothetical protein GCM10009804_02350 [Kribbella hippodromi]|uniref:Uncharacterized protein n=1 Tax=Kribbella hippodromi TaxID=434347 RepID=A0ABN2BXS2_9ACTN
MSNHPDPSNQTAPHPAAPQVNQGVQGDPSGHAVPSGYAAPAAPSGAAAQAGGSAPTQAPTGGATGKRPSTVVLAGAGSVLAVLAFLGGMAVGHSWDGTSNQQGQFGGPGGGFRGGFPNQGNGNGTFPGQGTGQGQGSTGQGQGTTGQGQGSTGQGQGSTGQGQGNTGQGQGSTGQGSPQGQAQTG